MGSVVKGLDSVMATMDLEKISGTMDKFERLFADVDTHTEVYGWMNGLIDGWMDEWINRWMDGWINRWMNGLIDGWMNGLIDG